MANKWLIHIKKTMKKMKATGKYVAGKGLKQVIMAAKKTWHKGKRGGGESDSDEEKPAGFVDVDLTKGTTGVEKEPDPTAAASSEVAGGKRRRKTRRRRASRRR
jgi:hypothetical protein